MDKENVAISQIAPEPGGLTELLRDYGYGPIRFTGTDDVLYDRHLAFFQVLSLSAASPRERFEAVARSVRDVLSRRSVRTCQSLCPTLTDARE